MIRSLLNPSAPSGWSTAFRLQNTLKRGLQRSALAALLVLAACASSSPQTVRGQDTPNVPTALDQDAVFQSWKQQPGVQACGRCHYSGNNNEFATNSTEFCRLDELKYWLKNDKHSIARRRVEPLTAEELVGEAEVLRNKLGIQKVPEDWFGASNVLSRRICDKLGYAVTKAEGYSQFRDNCLTCHGGYRDAADDADFARDGGAQPGISCNYCHQLDRDNAWVQSHGLAEGDSWRIKTPAEKSAEGMRDLVTVSTQASLCFDCHIGNRSENKFVAHEMYAAGHPPIPSIELETFCQEMPQHWQPPKELYESLAQYGKRDQYFQTNYPGMNQKPNEVFWNTRKMLIGMLTARKKALDLYIDSGSQGDHWGDYSLYDCAACHHELKSTSHRQLRGFPGAPGRPRQAEWPVILFSRLAGENELFKSKELEFTRLLTDQPFGDPAQVVPAAEVLQQEVEATLARVEASPITAALAKRLLKKLASTPRDELLTYDAARTVVWGMQTIAKELKAAGEISEKAEALVMGLGDPATTGLASKLPSGRQQFIYAESLAADLERRADFTPERLMKQLTEINQLLAAATPPTTSDVASR